ncbi:MAG: TIGR00282 family metallophosphoesterase [Deltaproteobacteria bacterium]|nr:TIGR00282 family metallophosphoesterase [Deltaproteobacteria bacterium]
MRILFSGDVFGEVGRKAIAKQVPYYRQNHKVDFVIVNGENASGGVGISRKDCQFLLTCGVDVITGGNHSFKQKDIITHIEQEPRLLRPANFPKKTPGRGYVIREVYAGVKIAVVSLLCKLFMEQSSSPFEEIDKILANLQGQAEIIFVDVHGEATSEKRALGWYLDGKVAAVIGTHTHVPTADEEVLPKGTAYLTDAGMTGPYDSVIGIKKELAIRRFTEGVPVKFEPATQDVRFSGVMIDIDESSGKANKIQRIFEKVEV